MAREEPLSDRHLLLLEDAIDNAVPWDIPKQTIDDTISNNSFLFVRVIVGALTSVAFVFNTFGCSVHVGMVLKLLPSVAHATA
jgi:hypothetical protein